MSSDDAFITLSLINWLIGGNLIIINSLREQGIPLSNYFYPNILSKLRSKDWYYLLALAIVNFILMYIFKF